MDKRKSRWAPPEQRFREHVRKTAACWLWTGTTNNRGYGQLWVNGRRVYAHRFSFELTKGAIPAKMEIDHLCRTPACVNPEHLDVVTHLENVRRGNAGAHYRDRTHCKQGHEFTPENTRIKVSAYGTPFRQCRTCHNYLNVLSKRRIRQSPQMGQ
jgi:hypothetical protein